ncbi:MAG TPA: hypothetical protein VMT79_22310 [Candidatus Binatia bacterium]|nr:hypothetical protein [Candidatus Binatia bacterium]
MAGHAGPLRVAGDERRAAALAVAALSGDSWKPLVALLRFVAPTNTASTGAAVFEG